MLGSPLKLGFTFTNSPLGFLLGLWNMLPSISFSPCSLQFLSYFSWGWAFTNDLSWTLIALSLSTALHNLIVPANPVLPGKMLHITKFVYMRWTSVPWGPQLLCAEPEGTLSRFHPVLLVSSFLSLLLLFLFCLYIKFTLWKYEVLTVDIFFLKFVGW